MTTPQTYPCNYCPGAEYVDLEMGACRCTEKLWWDGESCVNRTDCPCFVGHIPYVICIEYFPLTNLQNFRYAVGKVFQKEDCSECICKIGGVEHCNPKKCGPCDAVNSYYCIIYSFNYIFEFTGSQKNSDKYV